MGDIWYWHATGDFAWTGACDDPWEVLFTGPDSPPGHAHDFEPLPEDDAPAAACVDDVDYQRHVAWWSQPTGGRIARFKISGEEPSWVRPEEIACSLAAVDALTRADRTAMARDFVRPESVEDFWHFVGFLRRAEAHRGFDT